jgi:hypothetical protein
LKKEEKRRRLEEKNGTHMRPTVARQARPYLTAALVFFIFFGFKKKVIFGVMRNILAFWENGVQHLHFLKLAPNLRSIKSSIPHGAWRFHSFSKFYFC